MRVAADTLKAYLSTVVSHRSDEVLRGLASHPQMTPAKPMRTAAGAELSDPRVVGGGAAVPTPAQGATAPRQAAISGVTIPKNPECGLTSDMATVTLVLRREGRPVRRFILATGATLGREPTEVDIAIDDPSVSRRHVGLQIEDEDRSLYTIADLGSLNGTRLRGQRLRHGRIEPGEFFSMGDVEFQLLPPGRYDAAGATFRPSAQHAPLGRREEPVPPTARASGFDAVLMRRRASARTVLVGFFCMLVVALVTLIVASLHVLGAIDLGL